jgi:hypothetical protein
MRATFSLLLQAVFLGSCTGFTPEDRVISQVIQLAQETDLTDAEAVGRTLGASFRLVQEGYVVSPPEPDTCSRPEDVVTPVHLTFQYYEASAPDAGAWSVLRLRNQEGGRGSRVTAELDGSSLIGANCINMRHLGPPFTHRPSNPGYPALPLNPRWIVQGSGKYAGFGPGGLDAWYGLSGKAWTCADTIIARQNPRALARTDKPH